MIEEFGKQQFEQLRLEALESERLRSHLNVHTKLGSAVQRLFIATEPDTYMRPHRHKEAHKWEFFMVISGRIDLLIFSGDGDVIQRTELSPESIRAVQVPPGTWHCYVCMQPGTLAFEVKEGAYIPTGKDDFAPWAPEEYTDAAVSYLETLRKEVP